MLKAIIADDEIWVCQLIKKLIDWNELGIEIIAEADNGISALNLIVENRPDIVITDIRMPGLDGLELISKIKEISLNTSIIIISGYKHFEYARKALKFGVEDYILKPIKKDELTNVLKKLKARFAENDIRFEAEKKIKDQLAFSAEKTRQQFMEYMAFGLTKLTYDKLDEINKGYIFDFKEGYFHFIALKIDRKSSEHGNEKFDAIILEKASKVIKQFYEKSCYEVETLVHGSRVFCLLNYSAENAEVIKRSYKHLFEDVKSFLVEYESFYLTIGIGTQEKDIFAAKLSLKKALDSIKSRVVLGTDKIIDMVSSSLKTLNMRDVLTKEKEYQFIHFVEAFDTEGIRNWLESIFMEMMNKPNLDYCFLVDISEEIVEMFFSSMRKADMPIENETVIKSRALNEIDNSKSVRELINNLFGLLNEYLDSYLLSKRMQDNKPIRIAKQYVAENYKEQITLEDIAKIVHLNSVYFSVIFKKETGVNFSDYLINFRLDKAKELLKDTSCNVSEVADMVGYKDAKYFSKLFAKVIGIKPQEYRKLYS